MMQVFLFSFIFVFLYFICEFVPKYLEKSSNSRKGNRSFFKHVRTSLQNFPSLFQTHYTPTCRVLIKNSLLSFFLIISQETHAVYALYINQHINMSNTSIRNLTHTETNGTCIIDFIRHRMPYILESSSTETDIMSRQTFFSNTTFTSGNTPSQFIEKELRLWFAVHTLTFSTTS